MSGKTTVRPGLDAAAALCSKRSAVLIVARLDRLVRSSLGYELLIDRASREGWRIVALDTPEATTPMGRMVQTIFAAWAQFERSLISDRTREALAELKAQGARLGRPPELDDGTRDFISVLRERDGLSIRQIASELEARRIPAPHGGSTWSTGTISRALQQSKVVSKLH